MDDYKRILIVDDERSLREFLEIFLRKEGYEVTIANGGQAAAQLVEDGTEFDLVLTDLMMPHVDGMAVLAAVKDRCPDTQVLMMTAYATADTAIEAMKKGAFDYIQSVFDLVQRVADTRTSILVTGESGTGKELIAKAIHHNSRRKDAPLMAVNCGAIPENLMESEFFGHVKGAFTGAHANKTGMFGAADSGSIFLDEIGELPMHLQVKLLRVLQERKIRPVGSTNEISVDVRVIAATNLDLEEAIREGRFREDLYYRLNVIRIEIPPLRHRRDDVPLIARAFLRRFSEEMEKAIEDFKPEAMERLMAYSYPGNVRELENIVERAITLENTQWIQADNLPHWVASPEQGLGELAGPIQIPDGGLDMEGIMAQLETQLLRDALNRTGGNRTEAAKLLGISFRSIRYKLDKFGIAGDE
jgi:two-component system response regulator PilR (NtrC family)